MDTHAPTVTAHSAAPTGPRPGLAAVAIVAAGAGALSLLLVLAADLGGDRFPLGAHVRANAAWPPLMLWAWDRGDDLRFVNRSDAGVAYLAASVLLRGEDAIVTPRRNPLLVNEGVRRMAVLHVESDRQTPPRLDAAALERFVNVLAALAGDMPHDMLQIDFEARTSQRAFLTQAIASLRRRLRGEVLSVTALSSWCLNERWTEALAADEVVPMLFRLGPDGRRVRAHFAAGGDFGAGCRTSIGIATDELPDLLPPSRRVYVFNPRRWTAAAYDRVRARIRQWSLTSLSD